MTQIKEQMKRGINEIHLYHGRLNYIFHKLN